MSDAAARPTPLHGVTIVDLSRILAGPFATQLLADLGAAVTKIEPPEGDPTRAWGPPFVDGESTYFRAANRGKRTLSLDLKSEPDRARLFELLASADVVVENFLPRSAASLGLEPQTLRARFPRLIVASIRGFASDTEARDRAGYDFLMQAEAGWMSVTGPVAGPPMKVGMALVDVLAGLFLGNAIGAALVERARTGIGRHVEVPLFETALAGLVNVGSAALATGVEPARFGNAHPSIVPYQAFDAADGAVAIAVGNDRQFVDLLALLDLGEAIQRHPEWRTNPGRVADRDRVVFLLAAAIRTLPLATLLDRCARAGIPAGPVRGPLAALTDPSGRLHRAVSWQDDGPGRPQVPAIGTPILVDGVRAASPIPPPRRS